MKEFKIEIDRNLSTLELKIKGAVSVGWEPVGSIVIDEGLQKFYLQSLVKEIKAEKEDKPKGKVGRPRKES